ncbi:MAG: hypothetical protein D6748_02280, partial [Calditrichaeota bacterium]
MKSKNGYLGHFLSSLLRSSRTLKFRLNVFITAMLILVVGIPVYLLVHYIDQFRHEFATNMIETTTHTVYQGLYDDLLKNDSASIQAKVELMSLNPNLELLRIYRPNGDVVFSSRKSEIGTNLFHNKVHDFINPESKEDQETFIQFGEYYSHHHPIFVQKECTPCHKNPGSLIAILDVHVGVYNTSDYIYKTIRQFTIFGSIFIVVLLWTLLNYMYEGQIESR